MYTEQLPIAVQHFDPLLERTPVEHVVHLQFEPYVEHPVIAVQHKAPLFTGVPLEHVEHLHVELLYDEQLPIDGHAVHLHDVS